MNTGLDCNLIVQCHNIFFNYGVVQIRASYKFTIAQPPSTESAAPLEYPPPAEARYSAANAISSSLMPSQSNSGYVFETHLPGLLTGGAAIVPGNGFSVSFRIPSGSVELRRDAKIPGSMMFTRTGI